MTRYTVLWYTYCVKLWISTKSRNSVHFMFIRRDKYLNRLISHEKNGLIKIVSGIRRCGKSYLLCNIFRDWLLENRTDASHIIEVALDDIANYHLRNPHTMYAYLKSLIKDDKTYYIIIDEVQYLDEFVDVLNGLLHIPNADVYVTGSNSRFLVTDIVTEFRGRGDVIRIYPLVFSEFATQYEDINSAWKNYFTFGGLPFVLTFNSPEEKGEYLASLFQEVYITDIIERHDIRNKEELDELINILASSIGSLTNPPKLERAYKSIKNKSFSANTIRTYIDYLTDSFLISEAKRYNIKGKRYIGSPSKFYFEDVGLRNARLNFRQTEENHITENIIYNELRYRGFNVDVGNVEIYEKSPEGKTLRNSAEVDFVASKGNKKYYVQSTFSMWDRETSEREKKSLKNIDDSFGKAIIVNDDRIPLLDENGFLILGIKQFLTDYSVIN